MRLMVKRVKLNWKDTIEVNKNYLKLIMKIEEDKRKEQRVLKN